MRITISTVFASLIFFLGIFGAVSAAAQESQSAADLREEFRAALLSDPRTAALSEEDLAAMIDALVEEAEVQQVVSDFLPPISAPTYIVESVDDFVTPWGYPVTPPVLFGIILALLALAGVLLRVLLRLHKTKEIA